MKDNTLAEAYAYYRTRHLKSPNQTGWDFLENLRLNPEAIISKIGLGIADRTIQATLPPRSSREGRAARQKMVRDGVLKKTGFESMTGLVVPLYEDDELVNLYSYAFRAKLTTSSFVNDRGQISIGSGTKLILVESPLDVVVLAHFNLTNFRVMFTFTPKKLPNEVEQIFTLKEKSELPLEPTKINLPVGSSFFEYISNSIVTENDILNLLGSRDPEQVPEPEVPEPFFKVEQKDNQYFISIGSFRHRVTGLERNTGYHTFKVTLKTWIEEGDQYYIDSLDLVSDKQRQRYMQRASQELGLAVKELKVDMGKLLLAVEQIQEKRLRHKEVDDKVELSPTQREEAKEYLIAPDLIGRIQKDFTSCGMVGEEKNRMLGYLCATSRLLEKPLGMLIQSSTAVGKTAIQKAIMRFMPEESVMYFSSITAQSLYYMGETNLLGKILAVAEEEGSSRASYPLKLLLSEGKLTIASTGKDSETGATVTQTYEVNGKVSLNMTTTKLDGDPELANRLISITANESTEQTAAIHKAQKFARTLNGMKQKILAKSICERQKNIQRILRYYPVVNPFIEQLEISASNTRSRRDFEKLLTLVDTVTLLHQFQRSTHIEEIDGKETTFLLATEEDIKIALDLSDQIFRDSTDELPSQTRNIWNVIVGYILNETEKLQLAWQEVNITRRKVRELCGLSLTMTKIHMDRLEESEFLLRNSGKTGSKFTYVPLVRPAETTVTSNLSMK